MLTGKILVRAVQVVCLLLTVFGPSQALAQPTGVTVFHRSGQTFVTWDEEAGVSGERYNIYRHTQPIDAQNLGQSTRLTERWGALDDQTTTFWSERRRSDEQYSPNYVIRDNGGQLGDDKGLFVWTTGESGTYYYAVTTVRDGVEDRADFSAANRTGAVVEAVEDPDPVKVYVTNSGLGAVYTQYLDYSNYNPTFGVPLNSAAQQYGFNYAVSKPAPGCDLSGPLPVYVHLHSYGGSYWFDTGEDDPLGATPWNWCAVRISTDDSNATWHFGHSRTFDFRQGGSPDSGTVSNYTEERILRAVYDTLRDSEYSIDPERIYIYGHSMGGSGALSLAIRYPNVFSSVYSSEGMTNYQTADSGTAAGGQLQCNTNWVGEAAGKWGSPVSNLGVRTRAPGNWAQHLLRYDGTGVWDWQNHQRQLVDHRGQDTAYISLAHDTDDSVICWSSQGNPAYEPFYLGRHAFSGAVTVGAGHSWRGWWGSSPNSQPNPQSLIPFNIWQVRRNETVPGLSYASGSSSVPPDGEAQFNTNLEWSSSWLDWDGRPVDEADRWRVSIRSLTGQDQTVDVTPRRLQNFEIYSGAAYSWRNTRVADGELVASGQVTAGVDCLVTVPRAQVSTGGNRIEISPDGDPPDPGESPCQNNPPLVVPPPDPRDRGDDGDGGGDDNKTERPPQIPVVSEPSAPGNDGTHEGRQRPKVKLHIARLRLKKLIGSRFVSLRVNVDQPVTATAVVLAGKKRIMKTRVRLGRVGDHRIKLQISKQARKKLRKLYRSIVEKRRKSAVIYISVKAVNDFGLITKKKVALTVRS